MFPCALNNLINKYKSNLEYQNKNNIVFRLGKDMRNIEKACEILEAEQFRL